jgi:hypothetical protein
LTRKWVAIAKAEFYVLTAKFHRFRKLGYLLILAFVSLWALFLVPQILGFIMSRVPGSIDMILAITFPGLMRSIMMFLWFFVLIMPISNGLEGVRIGQWEIMLSNNVKTKDMLLGTYLGKLPIFGLAVFFLSPIMLSLFIDAYQVSIVGQLLMYSIMVAFALVNIWLSNIIVSVIQAKIGGSARGEDLGRALSWAVIPIIAVPGMAILYFMQQFATIMNTDVFLILPSTWCADFITWMAISFNGVNMPASSIMNLETILQVGPVVSFLLVAAFSVLVLIGGLYSSDRLFSIGATSGPKSVASAGKENVFLRGIRRIHGRRFGILIITSLKDYGRKLQNISKLGYAIFLSILIPLLLKYGPLVSTINDPMFLPIMTTMMLGLMLSIFAGIAFGGVGLLDSKDQLWIFKSTPKGVPRFIGSRITSYFLFALPYVLVPSLITTLIMGLTITEGFLLFYYSICSVYGAILIGIGITAFNPTFDNQTSTSFALNTAATVVMIMITSIISLVFGLLSAFDTREFYQVLTFMGMPLPVLGCIVITLGTLKLSWSENA